MLLIPSRTGSGSGSSSSGARSGSAGGGNYNVNFNPGPQATTAGARGAAIPISRVNGRYQHYGARHPDNRSLTDKIADRLLNPNTTSTSSQQSPLMTQLQQYLTQLTSGQGAGTNTGSNMFTQNSDGSYTYNPGWTASGNQTSDSTGVDLTTDYQALYKKLFDQLSGVGQSNSDSNYSYVNPFNTSYFGY